jgi:catecholate siderophore receptor
MNPGDGAAVALPQEIPKMTHVRPRHVRRQSAPTPRSAPLALRRLPLALLLLGIGSTPHALADESRAADSQVAPSPGADRVAQADARTDTAPATVLPAVRARSRTEPAGAESLKATTTTLGKGRQELRDIPQSMTVITERLLDDRQLDTVKDALRTAGGIAFQAAEGGEEDIRLRGFSLQASGDVFLDGMRDPAFYDRDTFSFDRIEVLRGSASMLFGRGSTGGVVNQVGKTPYPWPQHEVSVTVGTDGFFRATGDFNLKTGESAGTRVNVMANTADFDGAGLDKRGIAATHRWGIGMRDEFSVGLYHLRNDNGINYGLPWLTPGPVSGGDRLWPTSPGRYYGMASDYNRSGTTQGTATYLRRLEGGGEWRTALRVASYERDLRASAIRFAPAAQQPDRQAVNADTFGDATVLTRGTNLKIQEMRTQYLQSDYSGRHRWGGLEHSVQAGIDLAHEDFTNRGATLPPGVTLTKPTTRVGTPNDGASVDESQRQLSVNRTFDAKAAGVYVQDMLQVAPAWKVLGGLRLDRFDGTYRNVSVPAAGNNPCSVPPAAEIGRSDTLPSYRAGVLYQPTERQSYHLSYGTSFNTSGDAYQYDIGTVKVDPESSRNLELGGQLNSADGRFASRFALFHSTKYNERNRDADSVNACNYVLSGQRHAAGIELDLAGRLSSDWEVFVSYAFIPIAEVDASSGAPGTETVGSRPGLTPRHSGSVWTTYRVLPQLRIGAGLTARSKDSPAGSTIEAPSHVVADLMAEYTWRDLTLKASVLNVANTHYADFLYRGHYVAGRPRQLQLTASYRF